MYPYAIGFDIGITSVGWAVVALDGEDKPFGIINMGSRIFDAAEQSKTGASLAAPRREARSMRRRLRRHRHRLERIRHLLVAENVISQAELDALFEGKLEDIYTLRVKALDTAVFHADFARILLQYLATVGRDMVEEEVRAICKAQREQGQAFAATELEEQYLEILLSQRSFDEGPGEGSPYRGSQIEKMIGKCTLEAGEPRAAKASYSFEYFTLLQNINHLRLICGGESRPLSDAQREFLIALAHKTKD